jgi:hypothetical protein
LCVLQSSPNFFDFQFSGNGARPHSPSLAHGGMYDEVFMFLSAALIYCKSCFWLMLCKGIALCEELLTEAYEDADPSKASCSSGSGDGRPAVQGACNH